LNLRGELSKATPAPFEAWLHTAIMKSEATRECDYAHPRAYGEYLLGDRPQNSNRCTITAAFSPEACRVQTPDLISTAKLGDEVAQALADKPAILLRGNGQVTVAERSPKRS